MIENYQKFIGKVCTILTQPVSFPFKDGSQFAEFFSGKVINVDKFGIWVQHVNAHTMAFFTHPIVGIIEEQTVLKNDPRYEKIKTELEGKQKPPTSIQDLTEMAKRLN